MFAEIILYMDRPGQAEGLEGFFGRLKGNKIRLESPQRFFQGEAGKKDALYITDNGTVCAGLAAAGFPCIAYLTEVNADQDFSGASYALESFDGADGEYLKKVYQRHAGEPWEIARTRRCLIRETTVEDVDAFYEIYKDKTITRFMEDLYEDRQREIEYTQDYIKNIYGFYGFGIWTVLEQGGRVIGRAGVSMREGFSIPELGFLIAAPYQRQGYGFEVMSAVLRYAREELEIPHVQAFVKARNRASAGLCEKLGMVRQGETELSGGIFQRYYI